MTKTVTKEVEVPGPEVTVTKTATVTAKPPKQPRPKGPPTTVGGDGEYLVGQEMRTGTYRTGGPGESFACYWERGEELQRGVRRHHRQRQSGRQRAGYRQQGRDLQVHRLPGLEEGRLSDSTSSATAPASMSSPGPAGPPGSLMYVSRRISIISAVTRRSVP